MTIRVGGLADKTYAAENNIEYTWGRASEGYPRFTVRSAVQFWDQEAAEKFRDAIQELLEKTTNE
jgi:hypothetical protein